ncbi:MAG: OFA family MFS transporter [Candidatus Riflebacteria bacterium]|nr:OFA family MFS transporter [Candidatus Riflebacteria bacterium]
MKNSGVIVTIAGVALNLALGVLYAWSMFSSQLTLDVSKGGYGWTGTAATMPYTLAIAVFAVMMVPAGRLQDRFGPRVVATLSAVLTGLGLAISSLGSPTSHLPVVLGFGVFAGTGFGLGYAAATPAAIKWFDAKKKGLITGLVVGGFGLAPVYIAPLSEKLLSTYGISSSFLILGVSFLVFAGIAAQFITNPEVALNTGAKIVSNTDCSWQEMLKAPMFYSLYLQYACGATAGLMIIGHMKKIVLMQSQGAIKAGFVFVALLAIFNASGRVIAGFVSDIIGRVSALIFVFVIQMTAMFFFSQLNTFHGFLVGAAIVGFSYGACLSLFPSTAADLWGTKNLGMNYGILFTAWGVGGVFGPMLASMIVDSTGSYEKAYSVAGVLLMFATLLAIAGHISLSYNAAEKQIIITFGRKPVVEPQVQQVPTPPLEADASLAIPLSQPGVNSARLK